MFWVTMNTVCSETSSFDVTSYMISQNNHSTEASCDFYERLHTKNPSLLYKHRINFHLDHILEY